MNSLPSPIIPGFASLAPLVILVACAAGPALDQESSPPDTPPSPRIDLHVHLFGTGDSGSGCILSEEITGGFLFKYLVARLGIRGRADTFDAGYVAALVQQMQGSGLDRAVLFAQDGVYDCKGKLDHGRTHVYVPNDYLLEIVERHPALFIPCVSINPDRRDAIAELERTFARGARVLKIHPPIQGVDIADPKHAPFFRRCAELGVIVMVHTGHEHSSPVIDITLADPRRLELALESGCTVVACHSGSGWSDDEPDYFPHFVEMARKYERLWGDTSVMGTAKRVGDVRRLLATTEIHGRLLHGSDFPFPSAPIGFAGLIGLPRAIRLQMDLNWLHRDLTLKEALGFGRESVARAHDFLRAAGVELPEVPGK